jgi:hypothetical protein
VRVINEVKIVVTVDGPVGDGFEKGRAKSKSYAEGVTQDFAKAGKASSDFDRLVTSSMKDGESAFQSAGRSAEELRGKVAKLRSDFKETGNKGIFGDLTAAEGDLKKLEGFISQMEPEVKARAKKVGKAAGDGFIEGLPFGIGPSVSALGKQFASLFEGAAPAAVADAAKLGEKAGAAMADGVASGADAIAQDAPALFTPEGAAGAAILAAIALTLAPAIAAALASAVDIAFGAATVGLAAFLLKDEPAVRAAAHTLKTDLIDELTSGAEILAGPLEQGMAILDSIVKRIDWRQMFAGAAPAIAPLSHALGVFIAELAHGLGDLATTFGQVFADPQVEQVIERLGSEIAAFFDTVANNKDAVIFGFRLIVGIVQTLIGVLNVAINAAEILAKPLKWVDSLIGANDRAITSFGEFKAAAVITGKTATDSFQDLASQISTTAVTADTLAGAMTDKLMAGLLGVDKASGDFDKALVTMGDTLVANGGHLTAHVAALKKSETGAQQNKDAILAVVEANLRVYDSMISVGVSAQDAAAKYDSNTKALEAQLRAAGYTTDQIHALVGQYETVPDKVNTSIALHGLTDAIEGLTTLLRLIDNMPGALNLSVSEQHRVTSPGAHGHAAGGIASGLSWVGEQGAELVRLPQGSMVYPHGQSMGMAAAAGGGGGPSQLTMTISPGANSGFAALIANMIRTRQISLSVRDSTGNVQAVTVAGG